MSPKTAGIALLAALLVVLAAGCGPSRGVAGSGALTTDIFEDVPAPRGAKYRAASGESFSYESATFRCGRFFFEYPGLPADVADFYRSTMTRPPYNWTLTGDRASGEGGRILELTKLEDDCTVLIVPMAGGVARPGPRSSITIRVNVTR